jgi:hypothetical protein
MIALYNIENNSTVSPWHIVTTILPKAVRKKRGGTDVILAMSKNHPVSVTWRKLNGQENIFIKFK